jgi:hypothetical protein
MGEDIFLQPREEALEIASSALERGVDLNYLP